MGWCSCIVVEGRPSVGKFLQADRMEQKFTDLRVHCEDGMVLHVHKAVVCPQVAAIEIQQRHRSKKGEIGDYHLIEWDSQVVSRFFDVVYGELLYDETCRHKFRDPRDFDKKEVDRCHIFTLVEIFALADELYAPENLLYLSECIMANVAIVANDTEICESMNYIEQNSCQNGQLLGEFFELVVECTIRRKKRRQYENRVYMELFQAPNFRRYHDQIAQLIVKESTGVLKDISHEPGWDGFFELADVPITIMRMLFLASEDDLTGTSISAEELFESLHRDLARMAKDLDFCPELFEADTGWEKWFRADKKAVEDSWRF